MQANSDFKISCSFWSPTSDDWIVPWCLVDFWYASWVKWWLRSDFVVYLYRDVLTLPTECSIAAKTAALGVHGGSYFLGTLKLPKSSGEGTSAGISWDPRQPPEKRMRHTVTGYTGETTDLQTWEYFGLNPWAPRCSVRGPGESFHNIPSPCVLFCT